MRPDPTPAGGDAERPSPWSQGRGSRQVGSSRLRTLPSGNYPRLHGWGLSRVHPKVTSAWKHRMTLSGNQVFANIISEGSPRT